MKKVFTIICFLLLLSILTSCGIIRENIKKAPTEMQIPEGSSQAICIKDENDYTFVYQLDGVYQYFINGELQNDEIMNTIQEQAFLHQESVFNYLIDEFGANGCTITPYVEE